MRSERTGAAIVAGVLGGLLSGLFGIGGGTLIVPALVYVVGLERKRAHGTSLAAVIPLSMSSGASYMIAGEVDWRVAFLLAAGSVIGVWFGTRWLHSIEPRAVGILFVIILLVSAARLILGAGDPGEVRELSVLVSLALVLGGMCVGVLAGLLGIGGGAILVPMMILGVGMPATMAKGTSLVVIIVSSMVGTIGNRRNLNVDVRLASIVGVAGVISAFIGGRISLGIPDHVADVLFAAFLVFVAAKMAHDLFRSRRPAM